mgnify:FL=1
MTRSALYVSIAASVVSLTMGWGLGVLVGSRVNTAASNAYAGALHMQQMTMYQTMQVNFGERMNQRNLVYEHQAEEQAQACTERFEEMVSVYSERILGLRGQLHAHGIRERVVR